MKATLTITFSALPSRTQYSFELLLTVGGRLTDIGRELFRMLVAPTGVKLDLGW
jgi:hypothetical protein